MTQKYYLSIFMKAVMIFAMVMFVFFSAFLLLIRKYYAVDIPGIIFFAVVDTILISFFIWRIRTPVIEISETGFKVNIPFLFKSKFAKWDEVAGMVVGEINTLGIKEKNIKLLLKAEKTRTEEIIFSLKAVEKADEIIAKLREKIPEKKYEDVKHASILQKPFTKKEMEYKGWVLSETGITNGKRIILWENVKDLKYQGFVIAGYGATTVSYEDKAGKEQIATIQPSTTEQYQDVIRFLLKHAHQATIDTGLLNALAYMPKNAKADIASIPLFLIGAILFFIDISLLNYYSPTVTLGNIYPLLVLPFVVFPMTIAIKLMAGRFRGKVEPASKKILWSSIVSTRLWGRCCTLCKTIDRKATKT